MIKETRIIHRMINRFAWPLLALAVLLMACKRDEPTSWQTHLYAPIAKGQLGLGQIVPDSLLEVDNVGLYHLVYSKNLTNFDLDSLVVIPDTVIHKSFEVPLSGGPFNIPPNVNLITLNEDNLIGMSEVELKEVIAKSGTLEYAIKSYINGYLTCDYTIPGLTLNGNAVHINANTQPGSAAQPNVVSGAIDLSDYRMDLTGQSGALRNRLYTMLSIKTSPDAPGSASIYGHDSVVVELNFVDPKIRYAKGYFGQQHYQLDQVVDFAGDLNMPEGSLNLQSASLNLTIENYIGADARLDFNNFVGNNTGTNHAVSLDYAPLMNTINITRATDNGGNVAPFVTSFALDQNNSNLTGFIGNLPSSIALNAAVEINPLGNVSDANDFIYTDRTLNTWLDIDVPLAFSTSSLILRDTVFIQSENASWQADGNIYLHVKNSFPLNATISLSLVDEHGNVINEIGNPQYLAGAGINSNEAGTSVLAFPVSNAVISDLHKPNAVVIIVVFDTPEYPNYVNLTPGMLIDFVLTAAAGVEVSYE